MSTIEITYHGGDDWPLYAVYLGSGPPLVLLHGGGPDHHSLIPPADPARHTWTQYSDDVAALLDHLGFQRAVVGGTGLGATITQRTRLEHPGRVRAAILISVEDDEAKQAEIAFMDAFAERVRTDGIEAAWAPVLPELAPVISALVRDAIPRSDPASIAAAAARPRPLVPLRRRTRRDHDTRLGLPRHGPAASDRAGLEGCAAACKACGDECHGHASMHEHCRVCAEACRRGEQACRELISTLS